MKMKMVKMNEIRTKEKEEKIEEKIEEKKETKNGKNINEECILNIKLKLLSYLSNSHIKIYFENWIILFVKCIMFYLKLKHDQDQNTDEMKQNIKSKLIPTEKNGKIKEKEKLNPNLNLKQDVFLCLSILHQTIQFIKFESEEIRQHIRLILNTSGQSILTILHKIFTQKNNNFIKDDNDEDCCKTIETLILSDFKCQDPLSPLLLEYLKTTYILSILNNNSWPTMVAKAVQFLKEIQQPFIPMERQKNILYETIPFILSRIQISPDIKQAKSIIENLINELYKCDEINFEIVATNGCCSIQ